MATNIEIETDKDRIVNTPGIPVRINMDNIEIAVDDSSRRPRVEIPEKGYSSTRDKRDKRGDPSDSSSDVRSTKSNKDNSNMDYKFLINPKKYNPVVEKQVNSDDEKSRRRDDTDSERSKRTNTTNRSRFSDKFSDKKRDDDARGTNKSDEYTPRITGFTPFKPFATPLDSTPQPADSSVPSPPSFLGSGFSTRKSYESMDEDEIRKLKSHYLDQYEKKNKDYIYSTKKLTMKNDLEEIRSELEWITTKRRNDNNMEMWKRGLVLFVDGVVMMNTYANDPFDVDLTDWSKEMHWDVFRAGKYDEVLSDLIEKYHQSKVPIAPEWKLAFMMGSSLVFGVMQKKQEKARMKKRLEDEKRMEEKVRNQIREEIALMQFAQNSQDISPQQSAAQHAQNAQAQHRAGLQHGYNPQSQQQQMRQQMPQIPQIPQMPASHQMSGPSLSDDRIIKMMEANFIDSTINLDDSSISTGSTRASRRSTTSKQSNVSNVSPSNVRNQTEQVDKPSKKRGRPPKKEKDEDEMIPEEQGVTVGELLSNMETNVPSEKVITLPATTTRGRGGAIVKRRGRPPKNAIDTGNVVTLDRL